MNPNDPRWRPIYPGMRQEDMPPNYGDDVWLAWKDGPVQGDCWDSPCRHGVTYGDRQDWKMNLPSGHEIEIEAFKAWAPMNKPAWPEQPVRQELTYEI